MCLPCSGHLGLQVPGGFRHLVASGLLSLGLPKRATREALGPEAPAGVEMRSRPSSPEGEAKLR